MPAEPSSPIAPEIGHLVELTESLADERAGLVAVLARVADPRERRGVRHRLSAVVGLAVCAVLAVPAPMSRSPSGPLPPTRRPWPRWG